MTLRAILDVQPSDRRHLRGVGRVESVKRDRLRLVRAMQAVDADP
jgi:hypothetical protein